MAALILAAGEGKRMGLGFNKVLVPLGGKPLLAHTLTIWQEAEGIDEVVVVTGQKDVESVRKLVTRFGFRRVTGVLEGGKTRQESAYKGLIHLKKSGPEVVLIHDGARPFITAEQVQRLAEAVRRHGAATLAVPVKDTLKKVVGDQVSTTVDRSDLWAAQTPQGFQYSLILEAHEKAAAQGLKATDDAQLVERLGHPVHIVLGSSTNIKVTTPDDLALALAILQRGTRE